MEKKSKTVKLNYHETTQNGLKKRQYKLTLPNKIIDRLGWKKGDNLKVWKHRKKPQIEIRKTE